MRERQDSECGVLIAIWCGDVVGWWRALDNAADGESRQLALTHLNVCVNV